MADKISADKKGVLVLETGLQFEGLLFGARISADQILAHGPEHRGYGETVFNTSLTGYQEILTDPSYYGQMTCMTAPHIGNTGVNTLDPESKRVWCSGFIIHDLAATPSSWRSENTLEEYLKAAGVPGILGIDTRELTRHLRSQGVTRGLILSESEKHRAPELFKKLPPFEGRDLIHEVSTAEAYSFDEAERTDSPPQLSSFPIEVNTQPRSKKTWSVVAVDYGVKTNLLRSLVHLGCKIQVVPARWTAEQILALKPDGVFLSNGPGDPSAAPYAAETVRGLLGRVPVFGVCMGHQILSLAIGAKTYKLKFGHRGGNQPVIEKENSRVEISSHNHGYAVDERSLPKEARISHVNLNDHTVEGVEISGKKAFSVQYHPEACPGPHDSANLFKKFVELMAHQ